MIEVTSVEPSISSQDVAPLMKKKERLGAATPFCLDNLERRFPGIEEIARPIRRKGAPMRLKTTLSLVY